MLFEYLEQVAPRMKASRHEQTAKKNARKGDAEEGELVRRYDVRNTHENKEEEKRNEVYTSQNNGNVKNKRTGLRALRFSFIERGFRATRRDAAPIACTVYIVSNNCNAQPRLWHNAHRTEARIHTYIHNYYVRVHIRTQECEN